MNTVFNIKNSFWISRSYYCLSRERITPIILLNIYKYYKGITCKKENGDFLLENESCFMVREDFFSFIINECYCHNCNSKFKQQTLSCKCDPNLIPKEIAFEYHNFESDIYKKFKKLINRVNSRIKGRKRQERIKSIPGDKYTKQDVLSLKKWQENRCYYCSCSIRNKHSVDHIIPISDYLLIPDYDFNSIHNIVLCCIQCNRKKGIGLQEELEMKLKLTSEQKKLLRRIHKKVEFEKDNLI